MSTCLEKLPHECGTRHGLQVFGNNDGTVTGYCFNCGTFIQNPYGDEKKIKDLPKPKIKSQEEIQKEIEEISNYPIVDITHKKLRAQSLEYYGTRVALSEFDGKTPTTLCYPYRKNGKLSGYKMKLLGPKKIIWAVGDLKGVDAFGWEEALQSGARRLIVTEGEDDAISWKRILELYEREDFKGYTTAISLPNGAGGAKDFFIRTYKKMHDIFKDVYISFDMDEAGRKAVEDVCTNFPEVRSIDIPAKDANQCVIDGKAKATFNCLFSANKPKNTHIVFGEDVHEEAKEQAKFGELTWPWKHIQRATRGIRYGETIYIGGGVKIGKSEFVNSLAAHFIKEHDIKVLLAKPEELVKKTYKLVAGKIVGKIFHDPEVEFDNDSFNEAGEVLKDRLGMIGVYQNLGWEALKNDIIAAINWGAKAIFIDPITNLTSGMNSGDANSKLEEIAQELSVIAKDHNVVIFIFCHLKAPDGNISKEQRAKYYRENKFLGLGNCPHEQGGDVYSAQFAGSRAMMRKCNMMIGIESNKDPDLPEEVRNIRNLKVLEDREFGISGVFPVYWNPVTTIFKEL